MFSRGIALALAAASTLASAASGAGRHMANMAEAMSRAAGRQAGKIFGDGNIRRYINSHGRTRPARTYTSIAEGNRHGGPHRHIRERARRLFRPGQDRRAWIASETAAWGG